MKQRFSLALIVFLTCASGFLGASQTEALLKSAKSDPKDVFMKAFENYNRSPIAFSDRLKGLKGASKILSKRAQALRLKKGVTTSLLAVCAMRNECKAEVEELKRHGKWLFAHDSLVRRGKKPYLYF